MKEKFGNNLNKPLEVLLAVPFSSQANEQGDSLQNGPNFTSNQNWPIFEVS
jgi:hypothetical protein